MPQNKPQAETSPERDITLRSLLLGVVAVAVVSVLVTWAELILSSVRIGYLQLPPVAIAALLALVALASLTARIVGARWRLSSAELALVYIMCLIGAMVASHGILQKTIPLLVVPNYAADNSNNWARLFFGHIPSWAMPWNTRGAADQPVARMFFEGLPRGAAPPWADWLRPSLVWGAFWLLIVGAFLCLAVILRRQWIDNEKLSFPLAQLPLDIIGDRAGASGASFWRNPLTWLGIALPVAWYGVDWLHQFYPAVPLIPTSFVVSDQLASLQSPWNQLDYTPLIFSFAALGFFFLLPTDILFSIWFFFLFTRLQQMAAVTFNMDTPRMPMQNVYSFQGYQTAGAYFVLVIYLIAIARPHLARVWASATGKAPDVSDGGMLSYRRAVWGLIACLAGAAAFLVLLGMSLWFALLELVGAVLVIGIVMARSTAEAGMLMTEVTWSPVDLCSLGANIHSLGASNLALAPYVDHLIVHDQRGLLLTGMLDASRISDALRIKPRALLAAIILGIVVAVAVAGPLQIELPYNFGGQKMDYWMENLSPQSQFTRYANALAPGSTGLKDPWQAPVFFVVGILITAFLVVMRSLYYWWPLHPLGYALAGSWSTIQFWFPCLVAWILKSLAIRYGGLNAYSKARPVFLGLIVGEFGFACFSALLSVIVFQASRQRLHLPTPPFPWQ